MESIIDFISDQSFSIPLGQVVILIVVNSLCLLIGHHKLGLIVSYLFVFYWGYFYNRELLTDALGNTTWGLVLYVLAGMLMIIMVILGFFKSSRD